MVENKLYKLFLYDEMKGDKPRVFIGEITETMPLSFKFKTKIREYEFSKSCKFRLQELGEHEVRQ